ncbi:MAG: serine hydrolase [Oscillospiraceae bacterium]|nr:serine hydrolase [Oscillospiraceae bacterium]
MKKLLCIIFSLITVYIYIPDFRCYAEEDFSYVLMETSTRTVISENNPDRQVNAGYMSKLMSLLVIAESIETGKFRLDDELTASGTVTGTKGSVIWLQQGDKLTADELLKSVIIGNANDALTVLAEKSCRSIDEFVSQMNSRAFDLGLRNSAFTNPYGYYSEKDYTTAHDIAVISAELSEYDFLTPYFQTWRDFVKNGQTELVSENTLSRTFEGHIGFKACHSEKSGYCISEGAVREDCSYIAVILGASDEDTSFSKAKNLINKGFREFKVTVPAFLDELLIPMKVKSGQENAVEIMLKSQNSVVVPKASSEITNRIVIPDYITAPIKKGQKIGTMAFYNGDTLVFETDIITKNEVKKSSLLFTVKKSLLNLLKL